MYPYSICLPFVTRKGTIAPSPCVHEGGDLDWPGVANRFRKALSRTIPDKLKGHLFCPTIFRDDYRRKMNATQSGLVLIDVDGVYGGTLGDADEFLNELGLTGLIYTSFSHTPEKNKFRVIIPLAAPVDYRTHVHAWWAINKALGGFGDRSKIGCESGFFMPHTYGLDHASTIVEYTGAILSAAQWIEMVPDCLPPPEAKPKPIQIKVIRSLPSWNSLDELDFVKGDAIRKYLNLAKGEHHRGIFAFMMSVVTCAAYKGIALSATELAEIAAALDVMDGGWYAFDTLLGDAERAIDRACVVVTPQAETDDERRSRLRREYARDLAETTTLMEEIM